MIGIHKINSEVPVKYLLQQNYPNPFNPTTKIKFSIPGHQVGQTFLSVHLCIYDILGREVATLVNDKLSPGSYEVTWDGSNFSSGIYFYRLQTNDFTQTNKMVLIK